MNKKGQVLVLFTILIPVFLMLFAFIIDLGLLYIEDKQIESSIKEAIEYGLYNINIENVESRMIEIINKNIDDISNIEVNLNDDYIDFTVTKKYQGLFKSLFENNIYEINNSYYGYMNDGKIIINKE